ncbi:hypothetical protein OG927_35955 (plasmid) [Streptomyces clavifer]|uniref:hypothetical protein n=1 Tax=Streptomyces clavifer TaxID=68188 RepID=UPI002E80FD32|nr:hypothetical protein [Streptomyces clavifer]WUC32724.1 hypothetical protein OG927_35955 [Streptomyces clavifer]
MQHGQDGGGGDLLARQRERERKDGLRAQFGQRLRELLALAGLSSRAFAQHYPAYRDPTIRKYTSGKNLPPWEFLRDLLAEVDCRAPGPGGEQRAAELFTAYRSVLVLLGADIRGSDQNSLLLRLYDGEQVLAELTRDIELLREGADQVHERIEEERRTSDDSDTISDLERQGTELAGRREALVSKRADLVGDLERCRMLLQLTEQTPGSALVPVAERGEGDTPRGPGPRFTSRPWLVAGCAAIGLLVVAAAAFGGAVYQDSQNTAGQQPQPTPTLTPPTPTPTATPAPSSAASSSPSTASPAPSGSSSEPADEAPEPTQHKINLAAGYTVDLSSVEPRVTKDFEGLYYSPAVIGPGLATNSSKPLILLGEREKGSLAKCLADTRFSPEGIEFDLLSEGSQICAITDEGHVALVTIRTMPNGAAASEYVGLDITIWRYAAAPDLEEG